MSSRSLFVHDGRLREISPRRRHRHDRANRARIAAIYLARLFYSFPPRGESRWTTAHSLARSIVRTHARMQEMSFDIRYTQRCGQDCIFRRTRNKSARGAEPDEEDAKGVVARYARDYVLQPHSEASRRRRYAPGYTRARSLF